MAGQDSSQIIVAARTNIFLAPKGTAAPADALVALAAPWLNVGLTTPDSLSFSTEPNFQEVPTAQSDYPALRFQTDETATVAVELLQWNTSNFQSVYGGGTVTEIVPTATPKQYKFVPPAIGERKEIACIVEVIFGLKHYRYVFPRVFQLEGVQLDLQKGQESRLPLSLGVLGGDLISAWFLLTDDASFAPTV
jgi:hypothetical protein